MKYINIETRPYVVGVDGKKYESSIPTKSWAFESFDDLMEHYNRYSELTYIEPEDLETVKYDHSTGEVNLFNISLGNLDGSEMIIEYYIYIEDIDL